MNEQRNLIIAIALSVIILFGYSHFFAPKAPIPDEQATAVAPAVPGAPPSARAPAGAPTAAPANPAENRAAAIAAGPRVQIRTPKLNGSLALQGGRLDDLKLADYHQTPDPASPQIELLSPPGAPNPYYAEYGWTPADPQVKVPGPTTVWTASGALLTPEQPLTLSWDNGQGLKFVRSLAVDQDYMFSLTQTVENAGAGAVVLYPYALINRTGTPTTEGLYILHEGPLGVLDHSLREQKYKDLQKDPLAEYKTTGGWIGVTDKYWLAALIPDQKAEVKARFVYTKGDTVEKYQVDYLGQPITVAANAQASVSSHLFAGAKQVKLLDRYMEQLGIDRFDLAIDFGWFYFLTRPFFYLLQVFNAALGNFGLAILGLTVLVKALFFPLANKSYEAMTKMKKLQPEVKKLQERFADDKQRLNQEMMALYKREKANPVSGCLPIIIQIPVFFSLYKVLYVTIEMRHAAFYGWIHDLSAPDPTTLFNLFGLIPWTPPHMLHIGIWPLIMGVTMWLQQKLNPQPADPIQAKMMMMLPIVFTFLLANFPAGLVIYWAWSNSLSILQQWAIMKKAGVKV